MVGDLRVALFVTYAALLVWRSRGHSGIPPDWWQFILLFAGLNALLDLVTRASVWWSERRAIQRFRAMDPAVRDEVIRRLWSASASRWLAEQVAREGDAEVGGVVERFPFARGAKAAAAAAFAASTALGVALLVPLVVAPRAVPTRAGWTAWALAFVCGVLAAWSRRRLRHVQTILEVSPFSIVEVSASGRRALRWGGALALTPRPRWRRLELRPAGAREFIALDFDRVGIDRALWLVLNYGGFMDQAAAARTDAG